MLRSGGIVGATTHPAVPGRTSPAPQPPYEIDVALADALRRAAHWFALATAAIGALALLGWLVGSETLKAVVPGYPTMKTNTAMGFLLAGLGLRAAAHDVPTRVRRVGVAVAVVVGLIGGLTLVEYLLGVNLRIDTLLVPSVAHDGFVERMAPMTALSFLLAALALLTLDVEYAGYTVGATLAVLWLALAWLRLIAYLFGGAVLIGNPLWSSVAIHTALGFVCLGLGVIAMRPDRGGMRLFVAPGAGGRSVRRLVPAAVLVPLVVGGCATVGVTLGLYDVQYRFVITIVALTIVTLVLLLVGGHAEEVADSARRHAERQLALSEERWRMIAEQATDVVARHRPDGAVVFVSQAARAVTGYEPAELIGRNGFEFFVEDDVPTVRKEIAAAAGSGRTHVVRYRLRHKAGHTIWLESTFRFATSLGSPGLREIVTVSRDVTAQVEVERMRTDFIAMLSHDLKNPLGVLSAYLYILQEEPDDVDRGEIIARMRPVLDGAAQLAHNMIDAVRIESGSLPVVRKASSLDVIVCDVVKRQESGARLENIAIEVRLGRIPTCQVDARLVERALDNLLSNAIKYAPSGTRIDVETTVERGEACIAVRDRGVGVAADARATLFRRFQAEADSSHDSTGLGLFIVRSIAEAHGGSVTYEAPTDGGSRFCLHLPLDR
jgi:PAS domain S-box-containing protein